MENRKPYPSDVSDEEWSFVAPYLALIREDAPQRGHDLREVFNGLRWIVRTGSQWRYMPHDLPPWAAVYQQTQRWLAAGVAQDKSPAEGYHLTEDMTDRAISWVRQQQALMPGKPFFVYYAPGATHAPHHVPADWLDRYRGRFDAGWDALREEIFARQKDLGKIPPDAELTARPAWEDVDEALRPVLARQMEIYAAFLEHTDFHIGRLIDALEGLGVLDDTLVYYILGDNGASAEGTPNGSFNEGILLNGMAELETAEMMAARIDEFGTPTAYNHYAVSWAHAMCTPYQWTKQIASHLGGVRNGTIVHWPNGFAAHGEMRSQFHHVIDVAPTVLEAAGLPAPDLVHGIQQRPIEGVSNRPGQPGQPDHTARPPPRRHDAPVAGPQARPACWWLGSLGMAATCVEKEERR
jgi:arylsulfatase A-like enzyme